MWHMLSICIYLAIINMSPIYITYTLDMLSICLFYILLVLSP